MEFSDKNEKYQNIFIHIGTAGLKNKSVLTSNESNFEYFVFKTMTTNSIFLLLNLLLHTKLNIILYLVRVNVEGMQYGLYCC